MKRRPNAKPTGAIRTAASVLALAWLMLCVTATAQSFDQSSNQSAAPELTLEDLINIQVDSVYGASRYQQKVTEAPASISIVTSDEIKKFGYRTLADALRSVRGLYIADDRNYSYLGARGFLRPGDYNMRVLVLIDGHRMNDNVFDSMYIGQENMIDVDLIERIEFIRGPSSSIYGSSAFFGVINIMTKRGQQFDGAEISGEAGGFDSYKGRFSYGEKYSNDLELLFSGTYYISEGDRKLYYPEFDQRISGDPRATNNGIAEDSDGEEAFNFFSSLNYHELTFSGFLSGRTKHVPTASFETIFNDGNEKTGDYRAYLDAKLEHSFNPDVHLMGRIFYDTYLYYGDYPMNYAVPGDPVDRVLYQDDTTGKWVGTEWQLTAKAFDRHTFLVGTEYRENLQQQQRAWDEVTPGFILNDDRTSRNLGVFAQAEVALLTNLTLNAGLRYDHYFDNFGGALDPRVSLIYSPWKGSAFKALYGEAFRAPNVYELYYFDAQAALPELEPETIRTYELVYEQYFSRHYRFSLSGYYYEAHDLINQIATPSGDLGFVNLDTVNAQGVEFEFEAKSDRGCLARVSYALQSARDGQTDATLSNSPRHLAKLNLLAPIYRDNLFAGLELQYNGSVHTMTGNRVDDYLVANFTLYSRELVKNLEISASLYNIFNSKYYTPGAGDHLQEMIEQQGRSFRVKLTYKF